jgi:hypothetical protein
MTEFEIMLTDELIMKLIRDKKVVIEMPTEFRIIVLIKENNDERITYHGGDSH